MLNKAHRFHGLGSLNTAYSKGKTVRSDSISIKYLPSPKNKKTRVAVVVSKKVEKSAVRRNRIRRRIFEVVRPLIENIEQPTDIIISVFSAEVANQPFTKLEQSIKQLIDKSKIT